MKKIAWISLLTAALVAALAQPGLAHRYGGGGGHFRVGVWVGPGWGPVWWPYYPYYAQPPVVIRQQPDLYMQPPPQQEGPSYWYFCPDPQGYYPYVKQCPKGWLTVVPNTSPQQEEE